MKLETFYYDLEEGWSVDRLPLLDSPRTLVLLFGAPEFRDKKEPFSELANTYPQATIVGCSSSGEIFGDLLQDNSVSVAVTQFEKTDLRLAITPIDDIQESYNAGLKLAQELNTDGLRAVLICSDGIVVNGSELLRAFNEIFPDNVVVTGGLAGDGSRFEETWVIKDGKPISQHIAAVGLYGNSIMIGHGSKGGWDVFGPERQVTKANGSILYELDDKPALELYKKYLGELVEGLPATALLFPLSLRENRHTEESFVRTILGIDENAQSMTFAGDIPEGYLATLMKANFDNLVDGASEAAVMTSDNFTGNTPVLCIAISCVGRRLVLKGRTEEELEATLEILPATTQQIGFYSYGEISPNTDGQCTLHNQTMTLTTIAEK